MALKEKADSVPAREEVQQLQAVVDAEQALEASNVLLTEARMLGLGRRMTAQALENLIRLWPVATKLVDHAITHITADLESVDDKGKLKITAGDALRRLHEMSGVLGEMAKTAKTFIEAERLSKGQPSEVIGLQVESVTITEAVKQFTHMSALVEIARARGLVSIPDPVPAPDGNKEAA